MKPAILILLLALIGAGLWFLAPSTQSPEPEPEASNFKLKTSNSPAPETLNRSSNQAAPIPYLIRELSNPGSHEADQIAALHNLPSDLTPEELAALVDLLRQPRPQHLPQHRWSTLQNEIMAILREPKFSFKGYPTAMAELVADRNIDPVMRDYAAQHLSLYLLQNQETLTPEVLHPSLDSLFAAITGERESHQPVSGTSLMSLCDLYEQVDYPEAKETLQSRLPTLSAEVTKITTGQREVSHAFQVSALQVAGRLKLTESLPAIRELAQGEQKDRLLKISAIAALGLFADPADQPFLHEVADGPTKYRAAAQTALTHFSNL